MADHETVVGIALEEACLSLQQLASACAVEPDWVVTRVTEGLIPAMPGSQSEWRFTSVTLRRAQRMRQLERDFDAVPELAALFADMLEEMDALRAQLHQRGLR